MCSAPCKFAIPQLFYEIGYVISKYSVFLRQSQLSQFLALISASVFVFEMAEPWETAEYEIELLDIA